MKTRDWLVLTRAGFEGDAAAELTAWADRAGAGAWSRAAPGSAMLRLSLATPEHAAPDALVFARSIEPIVAEFEQLSPEDRLGPVLAAWRGSGLRCADVWVGTPDAEATHEWRGLARSLEPVLLRMLQREHTIDRAAPQVAHLVLESGTRAILAAAPYDPTRPWREGVPRLRTPPGAPSRSGLKLEEALLRLLDARDRERVLAPGARAVDLGAAPGGWSHQLARRGARVTAVDNGPLAPALLEGGMVEHRREDGFRFRPRRPVDLVVCDMVEQPRRVAALMTEWLAMRHAAAAIFNLKLPMKKRWLEVASCLEAMVEGLEASGCAVTERPAALGAPATLRASGRRLALRAAQLYHDREEITVAVLPADGRSRAPS